MPVELGYIALKVKDLGPAQTFYSALFGWEFDSSPAGAHVKNTKLPVGLDPSGPSDASFVYFQVQDINTTMSQIAKLGGTVRETSESPAGQMALCVDDQGTLFSLWQPAPGFA